MRLWSEKTGGLKAAAGELVYGHGLLKASLANENWARSDLFVENVFGY